MQRALHPVTHAACASCSITDENLTQCEKIGDEHIYSIVKYSSRMYGARHENAPSAYGLYDLRLGILAFGAGSLAYALKTPAKSTFESPIHQIGALVFSELRSQHQTCNTGVCHDHRILESCDRPRA
jgi:hypothetical protein